MPGILDIHRGEFQSLTDAGTHMAHNGVRANLSILHKKMKARGGALDHRLGRLNEEAVHADVANPGDVPPIAAFPINPDFANRNRKRRNPRRKSAGR
jgi:hypothetical protein